MDSKLIWKKPNQKVISIWPVRVGKVLVVSYLDTQYYGNISLQTSSNNYCRGGRISFFSLWFEDQLRNVDDNLIKDPLSHLINNNFEHNMQLDIITITHKIDLCPSIFPSSNEQTILFWMTGIPSGWSEINVSEKNTRPSHCENNHALSLYFNVWLR